MGIPKFYKWIYDNARECVHPTSIPTRVTGPCDVLCIDMNVLMHRVVSRLCEPPESFFNTSPEVVSYSHEEIYELIVQDTLQMIEVVSPTKCVFIAIDGVAGMSKASQQRRRRYVRTNAPTHPLAFPFDRSHISCGTDFMKGFVEHLNTRLTTILGTQLNISDDTMPGEGEAKIMTYLRSVRYKSVCVYSVDSDLILLLMGNVVRRPCTKRVWFLRDALYRFIKEKYLIMDMSMLTRYVASYGNVLDFIFLMSMVGNDFLPAVPSIDIDAGGIEWILHHLSEDGDRFMTLEKFIGIARDMSVDEDKHLYSIYMHARKKHIAYPTLEESVKDGSVDVKRFKTLHATKYNGYIVDAYYEGMMFVYHYYLHGIPSWSWQYPHFYAPILHDLQCVQLGVPTYKLDAPLSPGQQLFSILPRRSFDLVPEKYRAELDAAYERCQEYFPSEYCVDSEGKAEAYEHVVILPCIPYATLVREVVC